MLNREQKDQLHDGIYGLLDTNLFRNVSVDESRRYSPNINIHAEEDCDEDEAIDMVTDILKQINSGIAFEEPRWLGPHAGGYLYTSGCWCEDFGVTIYFIRSEQTAEAI